MACDTLLAGHPVRLELQQTHKDFALGAFTGTDSLYSDLPASQSNEWSSGRATNMHDTCRLTTLSVAGTRLALAPRSMAVLQPTPIRMES